jgi:hypothetical protein
MAPHLYFLPTLDVALKCSRQRSVRLMTPSFLLSNSSYASMALDVILASSQGRVLVVLSLDSSAKRMHHVQKTRRKAGALTATPSNWRPYRWTWLHPSRPPSEQPE